MNCPGANLNPNPNHFYTCFDDHQRQSSEFELSDYLVFDDDDDDHGFDDQDSYSSHQSMVSSDHKITATRTADDGSSSGATSLSTMKIKNGMMKKKKKMEVGQRFAFRTKSELEVMDDGFRWRKYGKKSVKNSPNPRNYYKCSSEGCQVKKRVERDREDSSYVITTYEGTHSHESPSSSSASSSSHHQQQIHQITFTSNLHHSSSSS